MKQIVAILMACSFCVSFNALASQLVHGGYTTMCAPLSEAERNAPTPTDGQIRKELGCKNYKAVDDGPDCKRCSKGHDKFVCRGTVQAQCTKN